MVKYIGLILVFAFIQVSGQPFSVGRTSINLQDASRNRTIPVQLYYSALNPGNNAPWVAGTFPLVILGHGFSMSYSSYENISTFFVPMGYVFAMIDTENGLIGVSHGDFASDIVYVKANLNLPQTLGEPIAYLGHSMGGGAAFLAAAQAPPSLLVGLAPAETNPSAIAAAPGISIPSFVFSGSGDAVTPPESNHIPMYDACVSECKGFISILGGAHCYFAQSNFFCDFGETTAGSNISISRSEQQDVMFDLLDPLFDAFLRGNAGAFESFSDSLALSSRVSGFTTCDATILGDYTRNDNSLTFFPSPVVDVLKVKRVQSPLGKIEVWSMDGKLMITLFSLASEAELSLSRLAPGIYFLRTGSGSRKFVKVGP